MRLLGENRGEENEDAKELGGEFFNRGEHTVIIILLREPKISITR